jgi:hypothetical protein
MTRYALIAEIGAMKHLGKQASAWEFGTDRDRLLIVGQSLSSLMDDGLVRAEPDDHTSIFFLVNPLDAIAKNV